MKTTDSLNLHWGIKILLIIEAIFVLLTLVEYQFSEQDNLPFVYTMMVVGILEFISLILVLFKKKIGLHTFFFLQMLSIIVVLFTGHEKMLFHIVSPIIKSIYLALILGFRNNGVSGWDVILRRNPQNSKRYESTQ